ncbi:hypothetical protein F2Q69_00057147 [Brassica cretica]|uniref:Uncharacterized protein n=1 Tax=Brassica cretica TaxID=69181 RepID=A0A8S9N285_BRACR|nr:hypothetical protein F2Q69_00057147 [Brassica cretica]
MELLLETGEDNAGRFAGIYLRRRRAKKRRVAQTREISSSREEDEGRDTNLFVFLFVRQR